MADNVRALPGSRVPSTTPDSAVVSLLEDLLEDAKSGRLQSFIGTGFAADGARYGIWAGHHPNVYEMLGAIAWLQAEYVHRNTHSLD